MVKKNNLDSFIVLLLGVIIATVFLIRFISPEDTWLCQKGEWVKHGNPNSNKPDSVCVLD